MLRTLFFLAGILLLQPLTGSAQISPGAPLDSSTIHFSYGMTPAYTGDTAAMPVWQIGENQQAFFTSDTTQVFAIMTDTLNHYPKNANTWFTIKIPRGCNTVVDFGTDIRRTAVGTVAWLSFQLVMSSQKGK